MSRQQRETYMNNVLKDPSASALVSAIEGNLIEHYATFGRLPEARLYDGEDLMWVMTGVPYLALNGVFRAQLSLDTVHAKIDETLRVFKARQVPMRWVTGPSTRPADLGRYLELHGVSYTRDWLGMAVDLLMLNEDIAFPPELTIEEVGDIHGLKTWVQAFCSGFHVPDFVGDAFFEVFAQSGLGRNVRLRHYFGCLRGEPVATCTLFLAAGVAGIYWVYTAPHARRQGIGAALTLAALRNVRNAGYRFAVLHSTQMGQGVYRQMGFEELCKLNIHVWQGEMRESG